MNIALISAFLLYFMVLLVIGILSKKKHLTEADFAIGNRSLNFWLTALSAHAADMSAWLFMAFPAAIFMGGLFNIWIAFGLLAGMFCNWQFVAPKLRVFTERTQSYTLSTFFERRFHDQSGVLRIVTALMSIVFFTFYLSGGLIAMGDLFESLFGIEYYIGISIATIVVVIYTFSGGFITVAWTDLFQALFLLIMIIIVPIVAFMHVEGGVQTIISVAHQKGISFSLLPDFSSNTLSNILFIALGWGLGYFGQPHIITKFMGIKDPGELHKSKYVGMTWQLIALAAAACVGLVAIGFFPDGIENEALVFVEMVKILFHPFVCGLILCGLIAANMSTMDSQILVCATVLTEDVYKHLFRKEALSSQLLKVSRASVVIVSLVSFVLACSQSATVAKTVLYAWSGLGSSFGPLVLMSLYSKSANRYGAMAGIVVGGLLAGFWDWINPFLTETIIPPLVPGFFCGLIAIYVVSKLTAHVDTEEHHFKMHI